MSATITTIPTTYARINVCPVPCRWCGSIAECEHDVCCEVCDTLDGLCAFSLDCPCHGPRPEKSSMININGVNYIPAASCGEIVILILQRGWVMVGRLDHPDDHHLRLTDAAVIRCWGTTRGLGEIAAGGPTADTRLDSIGSVTAHELTVVAQVECDEDAWAGVLS